MTLRHQRGKLDIEMLTRMLTLVVALTAVALLLAAPSAGPLAAADIVPASGTADRAGLAPSPQPPQRSVYLAFVGDTGTGNDRQRRVRDQLLIASGAVSLQAVFFLGDNL